MPRTRTPEIDQAVKELTFEMQEKNPRENPDDFMDFAGVVHRWTGREHQPFLLLWEEIGPSGKSLGPWSSGDMAPTPRRRALLVAAVEKWLAWIARERPSA